VQQWQGLIAVNYPARQYGLNRHVTITEAKKLCPDLIMVHVATWKEGDEKWAYHDEAFKNIGTHKVSLDPYRLESRRILACIKDSLPANLQKVEKAGIDEVFLDLSSQIHSILLERYSELGLPAPYDDPTENLPLPPTEALDWQADALIDLDTDETEDDDPDWDDIAILIGSEIIRKVRATVRERLKYTCSAGIAHNKMLAKLGSAHKKPNQQAIIRNRAIQQFLSDFKFTKIRNLGGKLGDQVVATFNTDTVKDLLPVSIDQLKQKLGDDTGTWVYQVIRGTDFSEVNSRTQIKSMLSAKSFQPSINTSGQAIRWLRIFVADIHSRLVEEGALENKRRPKTMNLHHRQGGQTRSRQTPIPQGKKMDETMLFDLAKSLLGQIILEGRVWPCANISLSIGGFEDGVVGNMGIGVFLVKGDEAKAMNLAAREQSVSDTGQERPEKRRRFDDNSIQRFFIKTDSVDENGDNHGAQQLPNTETVLAEKGEAGVKETAKAEATCLPYDYGAIGNQERPIPSTSTSALHHQQIIDYICNQCSMALGSARAIQSHQDWHFARDLQDKDRGCPASNTGPSSTTGKKKVMQRTSKKKNGGRSKPERGQSKLAFE